jgi:hypothetical protein
LSSGETALWEIPPAELMRLRERVLNYYAAVVIVCLIGIGILVAYGISLGTLVGPGVEESFGLAVAGMFLFGALLVHVVDRAYREWPLGRRIHPVQPGLLGTPAIVRALVAIVVLAAALLIAYFLWGLLTS